MILNYGTYRRLMTAIKKHCLKKGIKQYNAHKLRQAVIYKHLIEKFGSFVAVNSLGDKQLFWRQKKKTDNRTSRREFAQFIETNNNENHVDRSENKGEEDDRLQA